MTARTELLLQRLEEIGRSLARTPHALALIGLGSVGAELERLDKYSDLDFFAIVEEGYKAAFLEDLRWLTAIAPVAFYFMNTADGYKLLFKDGVFCEFAVFDLAELAAIPLTAARVVWKRSDAPKIIGRPPVLAAHPVSEARELGEALTNLYVGLGRFYRGEKLSAMRFIQQYAVDRLLALASLKETQVAATADPFAPERRSEQRFPWLAAHLPDFMQGYERSPQSAAAILAYLDQQYELDPAMKQAVVEMLQVGGFAD
jgi:hypothetical protein